MSLTHHLAGIDQSLGQIEVVVPMRARPAHQTAALPCTYCYLESLTDTLSTQYFNMKSNFIA